jgi:hypothetical protein
MSVRSSVRPRVDEWSDWNAFVTCVYAVPTPILSDSRKRENHLKSPKTPTFRGGRAARRHA